MIKAGESVPAAKGLDAKLRPIWRAMPIYPAALKEEKIAGRAEVEFVIDRTGRARVPKILSATRDEMGWAAATAISQWLFEPPTRGGEPVDVRVRIPLDFNPGA
jgi:TonB family protein